MPHIGSYKTPENKGRDTANADTESKYHRKIRTLTNSDKSRVINRLRNANFA
jgi:hypothetical protein